MRAGMAAHHGADMACGATGNRGARHLIARPIRVVLQKQSGSWGIVDVMGLMQQLGAAPTPQTADVG